MQLQTLIVSEIALFTILQRYQGDETIHSQLQADFSNWSRISWSRVETSLIASVSHGGGQA